MNSSGRSFTSRGWVTTTARIVTRMFGGRGVVLALLAFAGAALAQGSPTDPSRVLAEVPGFDFSRLPAPAKKELAQVLTDEFDYCGRPLTLLGSLKKGDACKHTKRMVGFAALLASDGNPGTEIINVLSKYNQTFAARRATFKTDDRMCVGATTAKVTLVEFADFECPYCAMARPLLEEYVRAHPAVRLCQMPFPLSGHPHSTISGQAALFARDNGKFWPMYDALFENQLSLSEATIKDLAKKIGLDDKAVGKLFGTEKYVDELNASRDAGKAAGVDSTPSLFVNGRKLTLSLSQESLTLAIDDDLEWQGGNSAWPVN